MNSSLSLLLDDPVTYAPYAKENDLIAVEDLA